MKTLLAIALLTLAGCRSAQSSVEVQALMGHGEPQIHVVCKVVMP